MIQSVTKPNYLHIKQMLLQISTYADSVRVLEEINKLLISDNNPELKSMRQKVYDIRRRLKLVPNVQEVHGPSTNPNMQVHGPSTNNQQMDRPGFQKVTETVRNHTYAISYANISIISLFAIFTVLSGAMIFIQSLEIYLKSSFDHPILATCGAILLICASTIIRALKPNRWTTLLCLYVLSFESYLMISGTKAAETIINQASVASEPRLQLLQMESQTAYESYQKALNTYEQNKNGWYKAKYLEPAKTKYAESLKNLADVKDSLTVSNFSLLKILYRLGLLLLFSMSVTLLVNRLPSLDTY